MEETKTETKEAVKEMIPLHEDLSQLLKNRNITKGLSIFLHDNGKIDIVTVNMNPAERLGFAKMMDVTLEMEFSLRKESR